MRLVITLNNFEQAERFSLFLLEKGIENQAESRAQDQFVIWVFDEDHVAKSKEYFEEFTKNPNWTPSPSAIRQKREKELQKAAEQYLATSNREEFTEEDNTSADSFEEEAPPKNEENTQSAEEKPKRFMGKVTFFTMLACIFLFLWASFSAPKNVQLPDGAASASYIFNPPYNALSYEDPQAYQYAGQFFEGLRQAVNPEEYLKSDAAFQEMYKFQTTPYWHGYYETYLVPQASVASSLNKSFSERPQFEQIAQGEVWRVFTPALLHGNIFHILFNMIWFVFLGKQIEERMGFLRYLFFILFAAAISNTAQYLMSGPNFLGLSGVIMAMAGYVWMRQTVAAWEGYTIQKPTLYFLGFYVLVLVLLQVVSFIFEFNGMNSIAPNIGNTAHVVGALVGIALGKLNFLSAWRLGKIKK